MRKLVPVEIVDNKNVIVQVDSSILFQGQNPNTEGTGMICFSIFQKGKTIK